MEQMIKFLTEYRIDVVLCALIISALTTLIKMPIKYFARKSKNCNKITRFITFLPIILGFGVAAVYMYFENSTTVFDELFFTRWLSSVSLSLAIYAFWEKFVPSKKKLLSETEILANQTVISKIENMIQQRNSTETVSQTSSFNQPAENTNRRTDDKPLASASRASTKIVLRGANHVETEEE